ncbi:neuroblastoma breakpoint family member 3 isoform X4 [Oryctolagus cuniculus]|uniref:neuroblastoma breakpoint family member 3 isoform X4 n=2 Tax=Oryctolagus cuniculus TaxID=9986 RepID=UPI003879223D
MQNKKSIIGDAVPGGWEIQEDKEKNEEDLCQEEGMCTGGLTPDPRALTLELPFQRCPSVPGYTHFATSIDMALTLGPSLDVRVETSEQLSSQLAKSQRESKELKEKLLRAEAKAYLLAKHLRDHNCEEYEDLIESMLREKPHFLEGQLAEELLPAENLKKCGVQIQEQAQELTQLQQKLQEGRALSQLIHQNLQALLTQQDPDSCQSRQLLTELLKLTEHLVAKLSTVNQTSGNQEEPYVDSPHTSRPSLRLAQLELLNGLPKPRVGPWWPCPMDNIVEMAYDEICASVWNLQQEECFFREAGLGSEYFWGKVMLRAPGFSPVHSHRSALQPPALAE